MFTRQTLPHPYPPPSATWKSRIPRERYSNGLWVSGAVRLRGRGLSRKTERDDGRLNLLSRKRGSQLPALSLSTKLPRASNSFSPQFLCKTKVNMLEHCLPEAAKGAPRSKIPGLVMRPAEKMLMPYLTPRVQKREHLGRKTNEQV